VDKPKTKTQLAAELRAANAQRKFIMKKRGSRDRVESMDFAQCNRRFGKANFAKMLTGDSHTNKFYRVEEITGMSYEQKIEAINKLDRFDFSHLCFDSVWSE
jgi:hypothetical protein